MTLSFVFYPPDIQNEENHLASLVLFGLNEIVFFKACNWIRNLTNDQEQFLKIFPALKEFFDNITSVRSTAILNAAKEENWEGEKPIEKRILRLNNEICLIIKGL